MALDLYFLIKEIYLINTFFLHVKEILRRQNEVTNDLQNCLLFLKRMLQKSWDTVKTETFVDNF